MSALESSPALRRALASALGLFAFTAVFTGVMAFTYELTRDRIQAAANAQQMRLIDEVLPGVSYDNNLLTDAVEIEGSGAARVSKVWRVRKGAEPVALVFETFAPDGYGGRIDMVISVGSDGRIGGLRVSAHKETPGLGDYIDAAKARKHEKPWVSQFVQADAAMPPARWQVKKDGGDFDSPAGATVSARAVTRAAGRAAAWVFEQREALFAAPAGTPYSAEQGK